MSSYSPAGVHVTLTSALLLKKSGSRNPSARTRSLHSGMDLDPWLPRAAALRPDHPALIDADGTPTTYAQLHADARDAAAVLQARGIEGGDRVALALPA